MIADDLQRGDHAEVTQTVRGEITDIRNGFLYLGGGGDSIDAAVFRIDDPNLTIRKVNAAPAAPSMPVWQPGDLIGVKDHTLLRTARNDWACTGMGCLNGHSDEKVAYEWAAGNVRILLKPEPAEETPPPVEEPPTGPIPTIRTSTFPTETLPEISGWIR